MEWIEVRLTVPREAVDALEEALHAAGAAAVTVAGADTEPNFDPGRVWASNGVTALFDAAALPEDLEGRLALVLGHAVALEYAPLEGEDWAHAWKERFGAFPVGQRLWVRPSWLEAPAPEGRVEVVLDPGMAFGTGQHETTRLCLEWLDARIDPAEAPAVLDYGCGSGLLAIAALKLGASHVLAVDNDPLSLEATRANAAANGVAEGVTVRAAEEGLAGWSPFPRVVANILSQTLVELGDLLTGATAPGGEISLSGILAGQADTIRAAYPGIRWTTEAQEGDWIRLDGVRDETA
jgi:ribosomal protein L11 methyltransferase